ncbi:MAG: DNA-directed RNA polymerase subunit beta [Clostridia bacterium]|nr:DNA-directed RNA polymerase subunit beta [Clostridia bacterium]
MSQKIHKIKCGNTERYTFSKIKHILDMPYLIEVQRNSYETFINEGIKDVFQDFSPITDYSGKLQLEFLDHVLDGTCKYTIKECKERDVTYTSPLKVRVRVTIKDTGEIKEDTVFMGDIPKMTETGTFIINGAERVVVSQLVRSPGVYTKSELDKNGVPRFFTTVIPNRGAWLEFEQDATNVLSVRVDRTRKITATVLLRALGYGTDEELFELFDNDPMIVATAQKDEAKDVKSAKVELYRRLRPGEVPTENGVEILANNIFFDARRYDVTHVGRYKYNKKLSIAERIEKLTLARDVVSPDGEILAEKGEVVDHEKAWEIQNAGVNVVYVVTPDEGEFKVIGNNTVDLAAYIDVNPRDLGIKEKVYYPKLAELLEQFGEDMEALKKACVANKDELVVKHITVDDVVATVNYNLSMRYGFYPCDNIDHLANRRVRSVGELLHNHFRIGMSRLERVIKERMSIVQDLAEATPKSLVNIRPVSSAIREFFGSSQLSQFMDQPNPIAELTHKRKLSALGPGGLKRELAGFEFRDVHHSHYGRMCPIETPEGQNIGLITSLSSYARINEYGFIEAPYRKVDKATGVVTDHVDYLTADEEDKYVVAQANEPLNEESRFVNQRITCRFRDDIKEYPVAQVDYMDVDPKQLVSVATSLIPFLENDDANRALMGSNMQRQAVPLLRPEAPIVGTGMEYKVAYDSGVCVIAKNAGVVKSVSADEIVIETDDGEEDVYELQKFTRSNQGTCINQRPIVNKGERVPAGAVLADGPATQNGELALGRNILIGFMTWEGYNYEDAILISEELVKHDVFTTIHIEKYELEARDTKLGEEQITRDIPNVSEDLLKNLDEDGIVMVGAEVGSGDYLVGKVTPKGETELTPEERLLRAIFGEKSREVRDVSLKVPHGEGCIVVDVKIFTKENKDELNPGVNKLVRVYIAQKRKISVGDKMAGRHGNKGVISRVLPKEDMPFMADGTPLQIVLNPLGVPSRMNIGQVLEVHLGLVANMLGIKVATPVFDGATENDIKELFEKNNLPADGKVQLFDGRTGEPFENKVTVGYMYMLKLIHLVDDKIHARSVGPYSLVTQQPLGGKAQFGGQRFGEMEVWALEAYGASHILQEILTVKSDDIMGRQKIFDSIIKATVTAEPGIPEAFKVLKKEMQSLGLDVKLFSEGDEEILLPENYDDADEGPAIAEPEEEPADINLDNVTNLDDALSQLLGDAAPEKDTLYEDDEADEGGDVFDRLAGLYGAVQGDDDDDDDDDGEDISTEDLLADMGAFGVNDNGFDDDDI